MKRSLCRCTQTLWREVYSRLVVTVIRPAQDVKVRPWPLRYLKLLGSLYFHDVMTKDFGGFPKPTAMRLRTRIGKKASIAVRDPCVGLRRAFPAFFSDKWSLLSVVVGAGGSSIYNNRVNLEFHDAGEKRKDPDGGWKRWSGRRPSTRKEGREKMLLREITCPARNNLFLKMQQRLPSVELSHQIFQERVGNARLWIFP